MTERVPGSFPSTLTVVPLCPSFCSEITFTPAPLCHLDVHSETQYCTLSLDLKCLPKAHVITAWCLRVLLGDGADFRRWSLARENGPIVIYPEESVLFLPLPPLPAVR